MSWEMIIPLSVRDLTKEMVLLLLINLITWLQLNSGDDSKFRRLSQNPTRSRENSLISYLQNLKWDGIIDAATCTFR